MASLQYGSGAGDSSGAPSATHDISRVSYHVKHLETFAKSLEDVRFTCPFLPSICPCFYSLAATGPPAEHVWPRQG